MDEQEAEEEGVKNPPKVRWSRLCRDFVEDVADITIHTKQVVFHDQRGKKVAHNPENLEKMEHE